MEAHALTARLTNRIEFPYLVMLMSGGHCLLAVVEGVTKFKLLGTCIDTSPGDMFDKTARRLKLKSLPHLEDMCGGAAIEHLALQGDPHKFEFPSVLSHFKNCNFSFSGLQYMAKKYIEIEEKELGLGAATVIPSAADLCASLQFAAVNHLGKRLYRAFLFCDMKELLPKVKRTLVLSGGVASNSYIRNSLAYIAEYFDCEVVCPPGRLCTDNGVMIAWNGIEKLTQGVDMIYSNFDEVIAEHRSPLGVSLVDEVVEADLKVNKISTHLLKGQKTSSKGGAFTSC
ncbi:tRNA N6-adenosine threonylcarbamoyltransferase, mitochondrial-like [Watersipora subatra]|uniref:tRNA N6-adenosine threonylcarbamoyltransferase, mitochondrial-like n=1 Tax=Watersipora subatra TaxID=2589382 RepID=UPI00355B3695